MEKNLDTTVQQNLVIVNISCWSLRPSLYQGSTGSIDKFTLVKSHKREHKTAVVVVLNNPMKDIQL